jgi:hypothetical protein
VAEFYYGTTYKVGRYFFDFRPDSNEKRELLEAQSPSQIGMGRTANIVRIDESGSAYEQITRRGIYEASHEHILADIQKRLSVKRIWTKILIGLAVVIFLIYKINWQSRIGNMPEDFRESILAIIIATLLLICPFLYLFQKRRKTAYLVYDIIPKKEQAIQKYFDACFNLNESEELWIITGREKHGDSKHHAGATSSVSRESSYISAVPVKRIDTNIFFPVIKADDQTFYFLPDCVLYNNDGELNAVSYEDLEIAVSVSDFREEKTIPSDSEQVGSTWVYVNADGSPDRRFNDNHRIPIMKYCEITIADSGSFCLLIMTSNYEIGKTFANALNEYKNLF